jgi:hypothetical protein
MTSQQTPESSSAILLAWAAVHTARAPITVILLVSAGGGGVVDGRGRGKVRPGRPGLSNKDVNSSRTRPGET